MADNKLHGIFKITPITPILISDGEKYQKIEYYIEKSGNKLLFHLKDVMKYFHDNRDNYKTALEILEDLPLSQNSEEDKKYIRYTLPIYADLKTIESGSKSSPQKGMMNQSKAISSKHTELSPELKNILKQAQKKLSQTTSTSTPIDSDNQSETEIHSFIKDPFGNPFIPGSSLKGCIRNALINYIIKSINGEKKLLEELLNKMQGELASYFLLKGGHSVQNAQYDLLKFLVVRDSRLIPIEDNFGVCQIKVKSKNANSLSEKKYNIFAECLIPVGENIEVEFYIDQRALKLMFDKEKVDNNKVNHLKDILTSKEKFKDALHAYSQILIKQQLDFFNSVNQSKYFPKKIRDEKDNAIFLQIGYGTGALSKTITVLFSEEERNQLANKHRWGKLRKDRNFYYSENMPYPKSRKLTTSEGETCPTLPMGWFKLDIEWK